VADQRASQKLLTAALNILKGFYEKKAALPAEAGACRQDSRRTRRMPQQVVSWA